MSACLCDAARCVDARRPPIISASGLAHSSRGLNLRGTMATKLDKSIKRELEHQGKLYTITLAPDGVKVVEKGKRNGKELSWASIISGDATLNEDLKISVDATRSGM